MGDLMGEDLSLSTCFPCWHAQGLADRIKGYTSKPNSTFSAFQTFPLPWFACQQQEKYLQEGIG